MNYFAHGRRFLEQPYALAGTALPDWLRVLDRRLRLPLESARSLSGAPGSDLAELARGVLAHHEDDRRFHCRPAFVSVTGRVTASLRAAFPGAEGFRASVVSHVLVEMLLDAHLIEQSPRRLQSYYEALGQVQGGVLVRAVRRMGCEPPPGLPRLVERFVAERFLADYADDERLAGRLDAVLRRVRLPALPEGFQALLPAFRREVAAAASDLDLA